MRLVSILLQAHLLQLQLLNPLPEFTVLLPDAAKIEVVVPEVGGPGLNANNALFKRRHRRHRPDADQARRLVFSRTLHLDRQAQNLNEDGRRQDGDIAVAAHEVFHKTSCQLSALSTLNLVELISDG